MLHLVSIKYTNYKSFKQFTVSLTSFNILVGPNNAGKSTIFYAIEYCIFGTVHGFKTITQLVKFNQDVVGEELIFKNRKGEKFKLQRMHRLIGKTRKPKGFYTLKKIESDSEIYILSSDFGDREDALSLKINEILGISKRFFETGIHFYQGTVSNILTGESKLDIVFGIKTATALSTCFNERAREFERDLKDKKTMEANLQHYKNKKEEDHQKLESQEEQQKTIDTDIKNKENEQKKFQDFKKSSESITIPST